MHGKQSLIRRNGDQRGGELRIRVATPARGGGGGGAAGGARGRLREQWGSPGLLARLEAQVTPGSPAGVRRAYGLPPPPRNPIWPEPRVQLQAMQSGEPCGALLRAGEHMGNQAGGRGLGARQGG